MGRFPFEVFLLLGTLPIFSIQSAPVSIPITRSSTAYTQHRNYQSGETLRYEMRGSNQGWNYQIEATDVVKRDAAGIFYEEIGWSNLTSNTPMTLSPSSLAFRQTLSLDDPGKYMAIPNLSTVQPFLIGPITDMPTFYADLSLVREQKLTRVGQHIYFKHGAPNSWADGRHVLLGQDSIDFDLTLLAIHTEDHTASLFIRHVPPAQPKVKLPAEWMSNPVSDTPNNWVEVENAGGTYIAQVGKETFEDHIVVDTNSGEILTAHLDNLITAISKNCTDAALMHCDQPKAENIHREVSLQLLP